MIPHSRITHAKLRTQKCIVALGRGPRVVIRHSPLKIEYLFIIYEYVFIAIMARKLLNLADIAPIKGGHRSKL